MEWPVVAPVLGLLSYHVNDEDFVSERSRVILHQVISGRLMGLPLGTRHSWAWTWLSISLASLVAQTVKCLSTMWETWVQALGWEDPLEKEMAIHSSTIAWKSRGQRSLVGCSLWGRKESDMTERLHFTSPFWNHVEGIKHSSVSGLWKEFVLIVRISINIYCSMHWFTPSPAFCVISGAGNLLVDVRPLFWEQSRDHTLAGQKVCIML